MRKEHDLLGEREIPKGVYWGIHTLRARENFPISNYTVHPEFIQALAQVKKACAKTNLDLGYLPEDTAKAIISACDELIRGEYQDQFISDIFQGGAGTSTNMNANEVIANRAIKFLGGNCGDYHLVHPNNQVNLHQSTNDVYPTAMKVAAIRLIRSLVPAVGHLQEALEKKALEFRTVIKMGRTQHQDAVPMTLGDEFSAYSEAMKRDEHRIAEAEQNLAEVNLGGTAIGTGFAAPKDYISRVVGRLSEETGLNLRQAKNLIDATQNIDCFLVVSGVLRVHAVNLSKITSDLMLLHSGPVAGLGEIRLPEVQAGSSIMAGKVNPVIGEMVEQVSMQVISNDRVVCEVMRRGRLELNAFLPLLSHALFESLIILERADRIFADKCISGIQANREVCAEHVRKSWKERGIVALTPVLGYERITELARRAREEKKTVRELILSEGIFSEKELDRILMEAVVNLGFEHQMPSKDQKR